MKEQEVLKKGSAPQGRPRASVAWLLGGFREKNQQDAAAAPAPFKLIKKDWNLNSGDCNAQRKEQENRLGRWLGSLSTVPCPLGSLSTTRPHVSPLCSVGRGQGSMDLGGGISAGPSLVASSLGGPAHVDAASHSSLPRMVSVTSHFETKRETLGQIHSSF